MSFNIKMMSDAEIDQLLNSNKRVPKWRLRNTQSEREHKRLRQIQDFRNYLEEVRQQELKQKRQAQERHRREEQEKTSRHKKNSPTNQADELGL
ncbi:hypothetical protein [uncultured Limosilactobacillus sp.]|uniref:hypothetical protein n=1 Tax=uncultured Limosilactobacillus sp. TaxID=2837629 RepID=UPI0025EDAE55|nr:hypothetical protein [uncultured Limosilactobacillus sp.]